MTQQTTFTIVVHPHKTELHTQAATGVNPAKALSAAIAALQAELKGLQACPAHTMQPTVDFSAVRFKFFKHLFHSHRQQVLATLGLEQDVLQQAVTSGQQLLLLQFVFKQNPELTQATIEQKMVEVAPLMASYLPKDL